MKAIEPTSWKEGYSIEVEWKGDCFWGMVESFGGIGSWEVGL
jgi:hypothetical protein